MRPDDALLSDLRVIEGIKGDRDKGDAILFWIKGTLPFSEGSKKWKRPLFPNLVRWGHDYSVDDVDNAVGATDIS